MAEKYALQSEIPNKLSQLENDSKFLADSGGWQGPIPGEKVWSHTTPGGGEFVLTEEVPEGGGSIYRMNFEDYNLTWRDATFTPVNATKEQIIKHIE